MKTITLLALIGAAFESTPVVGQCIEPEDTLFPADGQTQDGFGGSVDLDGDFAYVSGSTFAYAVGRVYVFQRVALDWSEAARIDPPHFDSNGLFGTALDKNGSWLAIGQPMKDGAGYDEGRVEMFSGDGATWAWHSTLVSSDIQPHDEFGNALSLDGTTLVVGAMRNPAPGGSGAVYIFDWDGVHWNQTQKLLALDALDGDVVGAACCLRGDWLAVGAPSHDTPYSQCGAVYIFQRVGGVWSQQAKLSPSDPQVGGYFGSPLALQNDRVIVGCPSFDGGNGYDMGKAYVFVRQSILWSEEAQFTMPGNATNATLGRSIAFAGDLAAIGATGVGVGGAVRLYQRSGTQWSFLTQLNGAAQANGAGLGTTVALDGDTLCSGAPNGYGNQAHSGFARTWRLAATAGTYCTAKTNSQGCVPQIAISGAPSVTSAAPCTISATSMLDNKSGMFVYSSAGPIAVTFQGGLLCVQPPLQRTPLQLSGGSGPCNGVFNFDLKAWMTTGFDPTLIAGARVWGQFWSRDPGFALPNNTNLTDAAYCIICP